MATMNVLDATGSTVSVEKPLTPGRAAAASSRPVTLSSEDFAVIDGLETLITSTNTKLDTLHTDLGTTLAGYLDGLEGYVDGLETLITSTNTKIDTLDGSVDAVTTAITGTVAHDDADSGNASKIGGKAKSSPKGLTLVANNDRSDLFCDLDGMLMVKLNTAGGDILSDAVSNTDGASTASSVFTAVASTRNYITSIDVFRTDTATTMAYVDFRDGTAGSVLWRMPLPAGGGSSKTSPVALFRTTANTALAYDVSSALTTVYINVSGYQSKV